MGRGSRRERRKAESQAASSLAQDEALAPADAAIELAVAHWHARLSSS
jgi:hypothetical protein